MKSKIDIVIESIKNQYLKEDTISLLNENKNWNDYQLEEINKYLTLIANALIFKDSRNWNELYKYIKKNKTLYAKFWELLKKLGVYSRVEVEEIINKSFLEDGINSKYATIGVIQEIKSRYWGYRKYVLLKKDSKGAYLESLPEYSEWGLLSYLFMSSTNLVLLLNIVVFEEISTK